MDKSEGGHFFGVSTLLVARAATLNIQEWVTKLSTR